MTENLIIALLVVLTVMTLSLPWIIMEQRLRDRDRVEREAMRKFQQAMRTFHKWEDQEL